VPNPVEDCPILSRDCGLKYLLLTALFDRFLEIKAPDLRLLFSDIVTVRLSLYTFVFMLCVEDYIGSVSLSEYYSRFNLTQRRNYKQQKDTELRNDNSRIRL